MELIISELFYSIQGETSRCGFPSFFIRLCGCNLNCSYCDTRYARSGGRRILIPEIIKSIKRFKRLDHVTITGGEPLLQKHTIILMKMLVQNGFSVQVETNGSILLKDVPRGVRKIVDVKTPSSGEKKSFNFKNLRYLEAADEIKFVLSDLKDYNYSRRFIKKYLEKSDAIINFSPVPDRFPLNTLADLIIKDRIGVRLNLQLHKIIWPDGEPKIE